ncbi:fungal specific transcription factor domain-containing protein [Microdochium nivale]|nr:fungal specific transcription factor domain-containing protein [Microdochium nivale]
MLSASIANPQRKQGACLECRRAKRKCDQLTPQCTQCKKKDQACSLQIFRVQTIGSLQRSQRLSTASASDRVVTYGCSPCTTATDSTVAGSAGSPQLASQIADSTWLQAADSPDNEFARACASGRRSRDWQPGSIPSSLTSLQAALTAKFIDSHTRPLQSATRRLLWDCFISKTSGVFLCWEPDDDQLDKKYTDPYSENIPTVAVRSRPMMLACLALSAFHVAGGDGRSQEDDALITSLMFEASCALATSSRHWQQQQQQRSPDAFNDLVAAVGTASLLYLIKPSSYADMLPLSRSAALCLTTEPQWQNRREPAHQAIMQIFRWLDICAQCSLKRHVPVLDEQTQLRLELQENERTSSLSPLYTGWVIHPLYAFAEALITPLRRVAWLIRMRQQRHVYEQNDNNGDDGDDDEGQGDIISEGATSSATAHVTQWPRSSRRSTARAPFCISPSRFEALIDEADSMVTFARNKVRNRAGPDMQTDLTRLATSIESAIVILYHTRLKDMPWTSPVVRAHVRNIVDNLCGIAPETRFANGVVFPLFVAGLEAVDVVDRVIIVDKIKHLPGIFFQREDQLLGCLEHVWALRDEDPGATWNTWIHNVFIVADRFEHVSVSLDYEDCIPG